MAYKGKTELNYINLDTIKTEVLTAVYNALDLMGFDKSGIDKNNPKRTVSHNQINFCFRQVYENIFKPSKPLFNNQKSIINYDDINQLQVVADSFLMVCEMYNKSLGLMSFSYMTGIDYSTLWDWLQPEGERLNPERTKLLKNIKEWHKAAQIGLLNESPVGSLAVANNDTETGLEWSSKQALNVPQNAVFLIPSERVKRLQITDGSKTE